MSLEPITRQEMYLAAAGGQDVSVPEPVTRLEMYLGKLAGLDVTVPTPVTRVEMFLAAACGEDVETPDPVTRLEMFLEDMSGGENDLEPITRLEEFLSEVQGGGGGTLMTYTGNLPATITALAKAIHSFTQYGLCTQAGTPTPSAPQDIKCNNGALKLVDEDLPSGYIRVLGFQCDNNAMWQITGFKLQGADTVRISFSVTAACNVFGCYQGTDATDNYDLYASVTSGSKYFRYGSGTYLSYFSNDNLDQRFDVVFTPNGSTGMPQDSTWSPATFTSANDLIIGSTTTGGTSAKLKGNLYGDIIVEQSGAERLHLIPCMKDSDGALTLGYYDIVGEAFYAPYEGYDGAMLLGLDTSHYSLQTVGTAEVLWIDDGNKMPPNAVADARYPVSSSGSCIVSCNVNNGSNVSAVEVHYYKADYTQINYYTLSSYDDATHRMYKSFSLPATAAYVSIERKSAYSTATVTDLKLEMGSTPTPYVTPQTASVADLFAVGDFADEQEIISGTVTRKCGIWVLTGEENWTVASSNADVFYLPSTYFPDDYGVVASFTPICSHLSGVSSSNSIASMTANTIKTNNSSKTIYACVGSDYTKSEWKEFIAYQYEMGTPVIIVYPLETPTTESVSPQHLHTNAGDNYINATAEVSPISVKIEYMGEGE